MKDGWFIFEIPPGEKIGEMNVRFQSSWLFFIIKRARNTLLSAAFFSILGLVKFKDQKLNILRYTSFFIILFGLHESIMYI